MSQSCFIKDIKYLNLLTGINNTGVEYKILLIIQIICDDFHLK